MQLVKLEAFLLPFVTEEDVPMNTDPSSMGLSGLYNTVKTYSAMQLEPAKHVSQSPLLSSPGKEATFLTLHRGINGTANVHHQGLSVEALSEGSNSPLSPNVQKSPLSLMHRRVFYLPSSPTVVSPPSSATLPSQASTSIQPVTSSESQKPQGGAPNVTVAAQLFSVPQSGQGALLQPVLFQSPLNSSSANSQAILMPISPRNAQKGQQLVQFPYVQNASQPAVSSPNATSASHTESDSVLDAAQNVKYLKGLDHKTILKLLDNMGLERYHQMFIKVLHTYAFADNTPCLELAYANC